MQGVWQPSYAVNVYMALVRWLVVVLMPPPLILLTLPPLLNAQFRPIEAPSPLVCWRLSSCLSLVCWLVFTSTFVACLCLVSPFVAQPPHASILNPSSLFAPAGCRVASLHTASASRRAAASRLVVLSPSLMRRLLLSLLRLRLSPSSHPVELASSSLSSLSSTSVAIVVVVVSRCAVAMVIVVVNVARCAIAIIVGFAVRCTAAIIVVALSTLSSPVAPSPF